MKCIGGILHVREVEIFWSRDAHGNQYDVVVGGLLPLFDALGLWRLFADTLFLLLILLEVPVSDNYLDCILEMDAIVGVLIMAFVEPTLLSLVDSVHGGRLARKAHPSLFEL